MTNTLTKASFYAVVLAVAIAAPALRAEWAVSPALTMEADWQENPRMQQHGNEEQVAGMAVVFDTAFTRKTALGGLSIRPRVDASSYPDAEDLESTNTFLDLSVNRKGERSGWSLDTGLARDTTLATELETTGIVDTNRRQRRATLASAFHRNLSHRASIGGEIGGQEIDYVDTQNTDLVDYSYLSAAVVGNFSASESTRFSATLRTNEFEAPDIAVRQRDYSLVAGVERIVSPNWSFGVNFGPSLVETESGDSDSGVLLGFDVTASGQRFGTKLSMLRSPLPTGRGVITSRDRLILSVSRALNERAAIVAAVQAIETEDVVYEANVAPEKRTYQRAELRFEHRVGRHWSASYAAVWANQTYQSANSAEQEQAVVSVTWHGRPSAAR
jgi:hypothetical protein